MYDRDTAELIASIPGLHGLDVQDLPDRLTRAYAHIVEARLKLVSRAGSLDDIEQTHADVVELRRLGNAYEVLTLLLDVKHPTRRACAFVAASAHHFVGLSAKIGVGATTDKPLLEGGRVAAPISAMLLFLIGEHQADAAEIANELTEEVAPVSVEDQLVQGLRAIALADHSMGSVLDWPDPAYDEFAGLAEPVDLADHQLWLRLLRGVKELIRLVLGRRPILDPAEAFRQVEIDSSVEMPPYNILGGTIGESSPTMIVSHPGPHHLARLLSAMCSTLLGAAIVNIPDPTDLAGSQWPKFLRSLAHVRPYLWRNHVAAIEMGFLEPSCSAVVTFPTGSGKSTLATLRIGAALARGKRVIYIAPTRALVDQVFRDLDRDLSASFPDSVRRADVDESFWTTIDNSEPQVAVMTPERCLGILSYQTNALLEVGLLVFDEAHLISGVTQHDLDRHRPPSRRALDAMLVVMGLLRRNPAMDIVLVSAMIANASELGTWLSDITGRKCLTLDMPWKPTRQIRGVVTYDGSDITSLVRMLQSERTIKSRAAMAAGKKLPDRPGKAILDRLVAPPFGLFSVSRDWAASRQVEWFPLLGAEESVRLNASVGWMGVTSNRNDVGTHLATRMVSRGVKVLVFAENVIWCNKIAKSSAKILHETEPITLTLHELNLRQAAIEEVGAAGSVYEVIDGRVACHHGLLLLPERLLAESAYARKDGLRLIVATPTLAQGMNLPAEAVLLAGDDRFEAEESEDGDSSADGGSEGTGSRVDMPLHEVLNAAGRAGRAGQHAHGLVLIVPGPVINVSRGDRGGLSVSELGRCEGLFASADQCLSVVDPVMQILDLIEKGSGGTPGAVYLLRRLPGDSDPSGPQASAFLRQSLGYVLRARGGTAQVAIAERQVASAIRARDALPSPAQPQTWEIDLSNVTGIPLPTVRSISDHIDKGNWEGLADVGAWIDWLIGVLATDVALLSALVDAKMVRSVFKQHRGEGELDWGGRVVEALGRILPLWVGGSPLAVLEREILNTPRIGRSDSMLRLARRFAIQLAPAVAVAFGAVGGVVQRKFDLESEEIPLVLSALAPCVREGLDDARKLCLYLLLRQRQVGLTRVVLHRVWNEHDLDRRLPDLSQRSFSEVRRQVARVARAAGLLD